MCNGACIAIVVAVSELSSSSGLLQLQLWLLLIFSGVLITSSVALRMRLVSRKVDGGKVFQVRPQVQQKIVFLRRDHIQLRLRLLRLGDNDISGSGHRYARHQRVAAITSRNNSQDCDC